MADAHHGNGSLAIEVERLGQRQLATDKHVEAMRAEMRALKGELLESDRILTKAVIDESTDLRERLGRIEALLTKRPKRRATKRR